MKLAILFGLLVASSTSIAESKYRNCPTPGFNNQGAIAETKQIPTGLESKIQPLLSQYQSLPGAAISVVKDGKMIFAKGWGYADLENCQPVTPDSVFYLKSTTKSFLGMAGALLHEQGKIDLSAPISEFLPELTLPEPLQASQVSLQDHFTHTQPYFNSGLNYLTAFVGNLPESEYVAHSNQFAIAADIKFRYSNYGPIMAAHALSQKTGRSWNDIIDQDVFAAAGMAHSTTRVAKAETLALAKAYMGGESNYFQHTAIKTQAQMHAAGGAFSSANDLAKWLQINLGTGKLGETEIFPRRAVERAQAPLVAVDRDFLEIHRFAHGLGVYRADYQGDLLLHHFGGETHVSFMPEHNLGVVVLSNEIGYGFATTHELALTIYDVLLGKNDIEQKLEERFSAIAGRLERRRGQVAQATADAKDPAPEKVPFELAGTYANPRMGEMQVTSKEDGFHVIFGEVSSKLFHYDGASYRAQLESWSPRLYTFSFELDENQQPILNWGGRIFKKCDAKCS